MTRHDGPSLIGKTIDNGFHVERKLGEGGMGEVYLAHGPTGGLVVLKIPRAGMLLDEPSAAGRFTREIRAMSLLEHPNIVKVYHVVEHEGRPVAVMQYLSGGTLEDRSDVNLDHWLPQIADALDYLHSTGLVHRDVKPANIFFDSHGRAYLGDFGIVKPLDGRMTMLQTLYATEMGTTPGTAQYMSPEAVEGRELDGRADQYALAIIVYECLAGRMPFEADTPAHLFAAHLLAPPHPLSDIDDRYGEQTSAVLNRALAKKPAERFASCREFAETLARSLGAPASEVPGTPPPFVDPMPPTAGSPPPEPASWVRYWCFAPVPLYLLAFTLWHYSHAWKAVLTAALATEIALFVLLFERHEAEPDKVQHQAIACCGIAACVFGYVLPLFYFGSCVVEFLSLLIALGIVPMTVFVVSRQWTARSWFSNVVGALGVAAALYFVTILAALRPGTISMVLSVEGIMMSGLALGLVLGIHHGVVWSWARLRRVIRARNAATDFQSNAVVGQDSDITVAAADRSDFSSGEPPTDALAREMPLPPTWMRRLYLVPIPLYFLYLVSVALVFRAGRGSAWFDVLFFSSLGGMMEGSVFTRPEAIGFLGAVLATEVALFVVPFETFCGRAPKRRHIVVASCGLCFCATWVISAICGGVLFKLSSGFAVALILTALVMIPLLVMVWLHVDGLQKAVRILGAIAISLLVVAQIRCSFPEDAGILGDLSAAFAWMSAESVAAVLAVSELTGWIWRHNASVNSR